MSLKERFKTCPNCGYEWVARTACPPKCPKCQWKFNELNVPKQTEPESTLHPRCKEGGANPPSGIQTNEAKQTEAKKNE